MRTKAMAHCQRTPLVGALVCLWLSLIPAHADPNSPVIRINDPFSAPIWRMDVDARQSTIVTSSMAKAVTVWSVADLKDFQIYRVPLRDEEMQRAHAIAISPDGKRIAYAVPPLRRADGPSDTGTARIYILDRGTGRIVATIEEDLETRAQALRFSPDGTLLAATLSDGCGLRVWRASDWSLAGRDDRMFTEESGAACCPGTGSNACSSSSTTTTGLAFSPGPGENRIVTAGDSGITLYAIAAGTLTRLTAASANEIGLELPEDVAFSPDGSKIAVGDARKKALDAAIKLQVAVLDASSLKRVAPLLAVGDEDVVSPTLLDPNKTPAAQQLSLSRVAWVENGGSVFVVAGGVLWCQALEPSRIRGQVQDRALDNCLVRWRLAPETGSALAGPEFIRAGLDRVMDLRALKHTRRLAVATLERLTILDHDGSVAEAGAEQLVARRRAIDLRDRPIDKVAGTWLGFATSEDLSKIYVEDFRSSKSKPFGLVFDLATLTAKQASSMPADLAPPNRDAFVIDDIAHWWNQPAAPVLYGLPLQSLQGEKDTYRVAVLADADTALIGSANYIRIVDYAGGTPKVVCDRRVSAEAYRAAFSKDGSLVVVGHSDGTVVWYGVSRLGSTCRLDALLVVYFRQSEVGEGWTWTAWQPATGKFAADGRNQRLLTWQIPSAGGQVDLVPFSKLRKLYDPAAVKAAIRFPPSASTQTIALEKDVREAVDQVRLRIVYPDFGSEVAEITVSIDLRLEGGPWPQRLRVTAGNGSQVVKHVAGRTYAAAEPVEVVSGKPLTVDIDLPESARRSNANVPVCFRFENASQETCHAITWVGPLSPPPRRRLWAVIAGFSAYTDPSMVLQFAQNDALDIARLFVGDYEQRVRKQVGLPDFSDLHVDLAVAASTRTAAAEMENLRSSGKVTVRAAGIAGLREALREIAARDQNEELSDDVLLFYYSGHGILHPFNHDKGLTALLGPGIDQSYSRETLAQEAMDSEELIALLDEISAAKLVIVDACRTTVAIPSARAFDPGAVSLEFESRLTTANVFFSASPGQPSLDQNLYAFDLTRPESERGNGLFTYALLQSLTARQDGETRIVRANDVDRDVEQFFDRSDTTSPAQRLLNLLAQQGLTVPMQEPVYIPARRQGIRNIAIRTVPP